MELCTRANSHDVIAERLSGGFRMVRHWGVVMLVAGALLTPSPSEARAGRGFSIGLRGLGHTAASPARSTPARRPGKAASGIGVGVVVPIPRGGGNERGPAAAFTSGGAAPRRAAPAVAPGPALAEPEPPQRPWCEGGKVVGGFCALN
jgi:hypothetical protein